MRQSDRQRLAPREIDAIFTYSFGGGVACCHATKINIGYGINSHNHKLCSYCGHDVMFIDNDFKNYKHHVHLDIVAQHKPKYATAMDILSFDDVDRVLKEAEEIAKHAQNVIVIPKVECVADIPEQYILGYPMPTSYITESPLPYSSYADRKTHLLGGAWQQQRDMILNSGLNIVSIDFNHCNKIAQAGVFNDWLGNKHKVVDILPTMHGNTYYTALELSLNSIRYGLNEICKTQLHLSSKS